MSVTDHLRNAQARFLVLELEDPDVRGDRLLVIQLSLQNLSLGLNQIFVKLETKLRGAQRTEIHTSEQ